MRLLVTTSHSLLLVDTDSGSAQPLHRGSGLYYGIAQKHDTIYVAARHRLVSSAREQAQERGSILLFDRALRLCGELEAPFPLRDMHAIAWHGERLWIAASFEDMIAVYDGANWERWFPLGEGSAGPADLHHFNSFMFDDEVVWLLAHKRGASELLAFAKQTRQLQRRIALGDCGHNVWREGGQMFTCSSTDGKVLGDRGFSLETGGFPRGVAFDADTRCVGVSAVAERKDRDFTTGKLMVFDREWRLQRTIELPGEGLILDLLPLPAGFEDRPRGGRLLRWLRSALGGSRAQGSRTQR